MTKQFPIEQIRDALTAKKPQRAVLERFLAEGRAEASRSESAIGALQARRRDLLLTASDEDLAAHDAEQARENRAHDRAEALVEEIERRLSEMDVAARQAEVDAERAKVETAVAKATEGLRAYEEHACAIRTAIADVESAEALIKAFSRAHPDEPKIVDPEARVRGIEGGTFGEIAREDIKTERVDLWAFATTGHAITDPDAIKHIVVDRGSAHEAKTGALQTGDTGGYVPRVIQFPFERVTYHPALRVYRPDPLAKTVVLPPLRDAQITRPREVKVDLNRIPDRRLDKIADLISRH